MVDISKDRYQAPPSPLAEAESAQKANGLEATQDRSGNRRAHSPDTRDRKRESERDSRNRDYDRDRRRDDSRDRRRHRSPSNSGRRRRSPSPRRNNSDNNRPAQKEAAAPVSDAPKKVTVHDILKVNPGMTLPEAVAKLNSYNTAIASGLPPPPLTGPTIMPNVQLISPTYNTPAMMAAAAVNATITGLPPVTGESGSLTKPHRELYVGKLLLYDAGPHA